MWNYRGYAQSTGDPSIPTSQKDALTVYNYYRSKGLNIPIVHGTSIGGAAAVGILHHLPVSQRGEVKGLIVDRSFSSIV